MRLLVLVLVASLFLHVEYVRGSALGGSGGHGFRTLPADLPHAEEAPNPHDPWDQLNVAKLEEDAKASIVPGMLESLQSFLKTKDHHLIFEVYSSGVGLDSFIPDPTLRTMLLPVHGARAQFPDGEGLIAQNAFKTFLSTRGVEVKIPRRPFRMFPYHLALKVLQLLPDSFYHLGNGQGHQLFQKLELVPQEKKAVMAYDVEGEKVGDSPDAMGTNVGSLLVYTNAVHTARQFVGLMLHELGHNWEKSLRRTNHAAHKVLLDGARKSKAALMASFPYVWPMPPGSRAQRMDYLFNTGENEPLAELFMLYVWDGDRFRQYIATHQHEDTGKWLQEVYSAIQHALGGVQYRASASAASGGASPSHSPPGSPRGGSPLRRSGSGSGTPRSPSAGPVSGGLVPPTSSSPPSSPKRSGSPVSKLVRSNSGGHLQ